MATPEEIAAAQAAARAAANSMLPKIASGPGGLTPYSQPGLLPQRAPGAVPSVGGMLAATPGIVQGVQQVAGTVGGAMNTVDAAMRSALAPSRPVTPGANINGYPNTLGGGLPPPTTAEPLSMSPEMTVPNIGFQTAGNIVVNGRNAAGKANDFSGTNIGSNAAYVTPNGQGTTIGGTGARAGEAGIGPAQTRNAVGPAAGLIAPVASDLTTGAQATGTAAAGIPQAVPAGAGAVTSPSPQTGAIGFAGIPTSGPAFDAANAPRTAGAAAALMDPQVARANALQDQQIQMAQHAIALASTGNMSDAIMAKHIRSTIAALSGVQTAGAGAVNPLKQTQAQTATQERDTDVQAQTSRANTNTTASVTARGQDIEAFFKLPTHMQSLAMAQLQAKAAAGDMDALKRIEAITDAQDKAAQQVIGPTGETAAILTHNSKWMIPPKFPTAGGPDIGAWEARKRLGLVQNPGAQ
jgi:hypothetical protein